MKEIKADSARVAACGLYCGACRRWRSGRCPGCQDNAKASWCRVRACCIERGYGTCADCEQFPDPNRCAHYNNLMSKVFSVIFNSDRGAGVQFIRQQGKQGYAEHMTQLGRMALPRRRR